MELLPKVKSEIAFPIVHSLTASDSDFLHDELKKIKSKNPVVAQFINDFSKTTDDKVGAAFCGVIVYKLLESQSEANKMLEDDFYL